MPEEPIRVVLTPEQRELLRRVSGQHVESIELQPDDADKNTGTVRFRWRLSASSGIPRQDWLPAEDEGESKESGG